RGYGGYRKGSAESLPVARSRTFLLSPPDQREQVVHERPAVGRRENIVAVFRHRGPIQPGPDPQVELPRSGSPLENAEREVGRVKRSTGVVFELSRGAAVAATLFSVAARAGEFSIELPPPGNACGSRGRPQRNCNRSQHRSCLEVAGASVAR